MAAPAKLALYGDIDYSARNAVLNAVATMVNNWNTYWTSVTTKCTIPDLSSGERLQASGAINNIATCVNAMNTEFSLGVTGYTCIDSDFTNFQTAINAIITQMLAMQTAKP